MAALGGEALVAGDIGKSLRMVCEKIRVATAKRPPELQGKCEPRLVAVAKTKPKEDIITAYNCGQRHFGENYVQELVEKGNDSEVVEHCKEIRWHLIGHLQRNKVNKVIAVPNLFVVETVDSNKLATALDSAWEKLAKAKPLNVMVQVNTSGEDQKSGVKPVEVASIVDFIRKSCPRLSFMGLMTIGVYDFDVSLGPNPDFQLLLQCRLDVCKELNMDVDDVELSMGMTADYEHAVEVGSSNVRVGCAIFGPRAYPVNL